MRQLVKRHGPDVGMLPDVALGAGPDRRECAKHQDQDIAGRHACPGAQRGEEVGETRSVPVLQHGAEPPQQRGTSGQSLERVRVAGLERLGQGGFGAGRQGGGVGTEQAGSEGVQAGDGEAL